MQLYLVRHGDAVSSMEDSEPRLSAEGRKQAILVAGFLRRMKVKVDRIECSTKTRAIETAEIIASAIDAKDSVFPREGLKPNDSLDPIIEDLRTASKNRMLVGHLPYMENLASTLLVGSPSLLKIHFSTVAMVCISGGNGRSWSLNWMISPDIL